MAEYNKHIWIAGEPILSTKMNNIEDGIATANTTAEGAKSQSDINKSNITDLTSNLEAVNEKIGSNFDATNTVRKAIDDLNRTVVDNATQNTQDLADGVRAWSQLIGAGVGYNNTTDTITKSLLEILNTYALQSTVNTIIQNAYTTPSPNDTIKVSGNTQTVSTLAQRIQHIYNTIDDVNSIIGNNFTNERTVSSEFYNLNQLYQNLSDSLGTISGVTLAERISALDGGNINSQTDLPERTIKSIIDEIKAAYSSSTYKTENNLDTDYNSLDARFEADEGKILAVEQEIAAAHQGSTSPTLDDRFDHIDGGGRPTRTLPSVIDELETARNGADNLNARLNALDNTQDNSSLIGRVFLLENGKIDKTSIENGVTTEATTTGKVLDARQGKVLNDKIDNVKSEVEAARISSIIRTPGANAGDPDTDTTYSSLDARLEAIETHAAAARTDVNTIANELNMYTQATHTIAGTNSRIDQLEENMVTMANEIGMLQDGDAVQDMASAITGNSTRIDTLAYNVSHEATQEDQTTGLTQRITAIESDITRQGGINDRLDAIDNASTGAIKALHDADDEFDSRLDAIDGGTALTGDSLAVRVANAENAISHNASGNDPGGLTERIIALETTPLSSTVIIENVTYNNDGIPTNIGTTPSADVDYLLKKDNQYYYWKYINNKWELISGAGGSGTSSAEFYATLLDVPNPPQETVDYFIGTGSNYVHYRYLNNAWVTILPTGLINNINVTLNGGLSASEMGSNVNKLADFIALKNVAMTTNYTDETQEEVESYTLTFTDTNGEDHPFTLAAGGGSGSSSLITATLNRIGGGSLTTITGESCIIGFNYTATDSSGDTIATTSTATWSINRAQVATSTVVIGDNSFDITQYLHTGENNITLVVTSNIDNQIITRNKTWVVDVKNFYLEWEYDESTINEGNTIEFSCIPYGIDITKTLHLKVGTHEQSQTITTSGIPTTVTLENNYTHGTYTAEMWMTATINGASKETSPHIFHDIIIVESGNATPIIAATLPETAMDQYNTISIPFVVYTPDSNTSTVTLAVDGVVQDTRTVGRATQTWNYTPITSGNKVLTITTGVVEKILNLTVNSININNNEIGGYAFKLKASEIPSNNALQAWAYTPNDNSTKLQFSNNFDWINGGIKTEIDENGQLRQFIKIKSGTTMTIPYKMFASDPRANGSNFKIVFKVENCRDYDAIVATNIADNIGIQLNAHGATFHSTTTEITTQYGEEEYTELEFEVYKQTTSNGATAIDQYMMAWVDGVITTARAYGGNFVQTNENASNFIIGSNKCDVCIYLVKYYPTVLSRKDHITNFIADAPNAVEMIQRYNRNDILDANEDIDYNKLAQKNRDCRVWLYDIDRMTKAKDDLINVNQFQQIWENGDQYYQLQGTNAKLKIQGTSSFNYRFGAANTDIDFGKKKAPNATLVDGYGNNLLADELEYKGFKINDDSLPITYSNTKVNFASCEQVNNMCNAEWYQRYQPFPSLSARDCMEFAMGVQFIKDRHLEEPADGIVLFTEKGASFNPEKYYMYSIANMGTSKKNTHIFHSEDELCIEIKENTTDAQKMKSFDADWVLSDHAGNYEIRYPDIKPADFTQEIKDGWERFVRWMVASNPGAATGAALSQPVTFEPYTFRGHNREVTQVEGRHFEQVLRGVTVSQYAGTYTNDTFEYRMAKMLSECEDYMAMDSVIYHFCYIERHTMVDNVAKNTFWSSLKEIGGPNDAEGYWIWDLSKNYDNDTSDGNNNNGLLVFDYGNEAHDTREGTPVFNGHDTVWFVFASNLYEACRAMFVNREAVGAWNSINYHNYLLSEQRKVPERVWNECYWYDYLRTYEQSMGGDTNVQSTWINFLDGGQKIHQRKHYETYEEIYDSSKYRGSFSHNQSITLRGEAIDYQALNLPAQESKFEITMFNKCYLTIWIGTNYQTVKCEKGVPQTLYFYEDNDPSKGYMSLSNSVIDIDSGSMVQEIGDLSLIYPSSGQFAAAKRLRSLQIGSDVEGYYNPNMNNSSVLTFNNKMLEELYVQNLPQATYNLDLSNCPELKYLDAKGSGFTGFVFANGGLLNEAYVNAPASLVMQNLNYLTKSNFHLTTPTAVTSLRLEKSTNIFDDYAFINELTNLNVLRLTNINWTLNDNTLLDRLLTYMGIDETGATVPMSYLSGNVILTGRVYEGDYNTYMAAWSPDLTIDKSQSQFVSQHLVTYTDEDGTELYTRYINHGEDLIDPYATGLLTTAPEKDPDIENEYIFGQLDYTEHYIPFSGWRLSTDSQSIYDKYGTSTPHVPVNGAMTARATFSSTKQKYRVRWYLRQNVLVEESEPKNYGSGYDLIAPTIKDIQAKNLNTYTFSTNGDLCSYSIMTGWNKLPTNITPTEIGGTYDIYATWLERTNVNYQTVLTSDAYSTEEKLLVLKEMSIARTNAQYNFSIRDLYPIVMGYNGTKPAIDLVSTPRRFNGSIEVLNDYAPFSANKSFTMAIDYRFEPVSNSVASEAILLSCYGEAGDSYQGFKLYYNPKTMSPPQVSFGETLVATEKVNTQVIGNSIAKRNMVVLRHVANDPLLYIYCGADNTGLITEYSNNSFRRTAEWSGITSNAKIVLGGTNINNASMMNATGTIYSIKYWEEDLGEGECAQLANWCHETMYFAVSDFQEAGSASHSAINNTMNPSFVLHTLNASEMGTITEASINRGEVIGWVPSTVHTFYNSRLYQALPVALQSIISKVDVPYNKATWNGEQYIINSGAFTEKDYVFAPSCIEVGTDGTTASNHSIEASGSFNWNNSGGLRVRTYNNGTFIDGSMINAYANLRFPYYYNTLNIERTVYTNYPSTGSSFYTRAAELSITLRTGDILVPNDSTVAYMYVEAADINRGAPVVTNPDGFLIAARGGWIESTGWWTRSVPNSIYPGTNTSRFLFLDDLGVLKDGNARTHGIVYSIGL